MKTRFAFVSAFVFAYALASAAVAGAQAGYDPLAITGTVPAPRDFDVRDTVRQRTVPIRVFLPARPAAGGAPVLLFSHGLGGARTNNAYLGKHWAGRGYAVVFLQHPGSDESVWQDVPLRDRMRDMRTAANMQNFMLRVRDVPAVLNTLTVWNADAQHPLHGALDLSRLGMSGHSFGAVTTQAVSGQTLPSGQSPYRDARIDAAMIMSPSTPQRVTARQAFGKVSLPWLLMTGTKDEAVVGNATVENRLSVYPALPAGGKYELVLHDGEHAAFGDQPALRGQGARNPNHHRAILALSTAFWDAYLLKDAAARAWLDGAGARSALGREDRWQRK